MNLIEKIQETQNESFNKWFDRWYKKQNLEDAIIQSAAQGYSSYLFIVKEPDESVSDWSKKREYLVRRLRDERTVEKIKEKLGAGIDVEYREVVKYHTNFFNRQYSTTKAYIEISWDSSGGEQK